MIVAIAAMDILHFFSDSGKKVGWCFTSIFRIFVLTLVHL